MDKVKTDELQKKAIQDQNDTISSISENKRTPQHLSVEENNSLESKRIYQSKAVLNFLPLSQIYEPRNIKNRQEVY